MAVESGFWNSLGADVRTYHNHDFSHLISNLVKDGIHQTYGNQFIVLPGSGMQVIVQTGECWFNNTWVRNDSDLQVNIDTAPIVAGFSRLDSIAIKIDATSSVRLGTIEYVAGTPTSETPSAPELVDTDDIHWHLLATVLVETNATEITASKITNYIGTDDTPFISGILETISAESLLNQWQGEWEEWTGEKSAEWSEWSQQKKQEFTVWFADLHYILDGDVAGHLQNEIEALARHIGFVGTTEEVEAAIAQGQIEEGMVVFITDDEGDTDISALQVAYDNTTSGLESTETQGAIDELKGVTDQLNNDLSEIKTALYPIGCIIESTTCSTMASVVSAYGGTTWIQHSGYFLRGASSGVVSNSATATGGEDTHVLTINEMPSHNHGFTEGTDMVGGANVTRSSTWTLTGTTQNTGGGQAHNNIPKYKSVYIWERTA